MLKSVPRAAAAVDALLEFGPSQAKIYSIGIGLPMSITTVKCENWGFITQHQSI